MKVIRYILSILLILLALGLTAYALFVAKDLDAGDIAKIVTVICGAFAAIFSPQKKKKTISNKKALYQSSYSHYIQNAFYDDKKLEKKFYAAVDDVNQKKPAAAIDKLKALRPYCQRSADLYAVTVFTALCYDNMCLYHDAITHYEAALSIKEDCVLASNMGFCYDRLGDYDSAIHAYHRAIRIDPKHASPYNNMAQLHMRLGKYDTALDYAQKAHERNQKLPSAINALAVCHYMLGDQDAYQRFLRLATASGSDPKNIKAYIAKIESAM